MNEPLPQPGEQVLDLLARRQEMQRQGTSLSVADLCADCPELVAEVERLARFSSALEALAHPSADTGPPTEDATPAPADSQQQTTLPTTGQRYEIQRLLGKGGIGAVYRARDCVLDRVVASKVIHGAALGTVREGANEDTACVDFLAPPQTPLELGRVGPYRVLKILGRGATGIVFRAEDVALGRPVAVKVLKSELRARPAARQRFLRELSRIAEFVPIIQIVRECQDPKDDKFLEVAWCRPSTPFIMTSFRTSGWSIPT